MATLSVPIAKAGNTTIDIDTDALPDAMYQLVLAEGLKVLLNARMSKVGSVTKLEGAEKESATAAALKIANENADALRAGTIKKGRAASGAKVAGVVMTEARRLAKEVVKNTIRAAGMKVSHVEASEITKAANELIASDPSYVEQAKTNLEARKAKVPTAENEEAAKAAALDMLSKIGGVHESAKLTAAAEKAKAEKRTQLSAKQAGTVAPRKATVIPSASIQ